MIDPIGTREDGDVIKFNDTLYLVNYIARIYVTVGKFQSVPMYFSVKTLATIATTNRESADKFSTLDDAKGWVKSFYDTLDGWEFEQVVIGELEP